MTMNTEFQGMLDAINDASQKVDELILVATEWMKVFLQALPPPHQLRLKIEIPYISIKGDWHDNITAFGLSEDEEVIAVLRHDEEGVPLPVVPNDVVIQMLSSIRWPRPLPATLPPIPVSGSIPPAS